MPSTVLETIREQYKESNTKISVELVINYVQAQQVLKGYSTPKSNLVCCHIPQSQM